MSEIQNPSLSKDKIKILLLEGISDSAVNTLYQAGYENVERLATALDGQALIDKLADTRILGIRSRTQITRDVLQETTRMIAVGCFSVGTNQINLDAARSKGIPVFNAPFSNTRSVAELTIAEIIMLFRRTFPRSMAAHHGRWEKSASRSNEIRGKTLGIVGYGNIGSQLAVLAEAMGLRVIYYDHTDKLRHGNVEPMTSLDELLAVADVVTLHVPATAETSHLIGREALALMKPGAALINTARGDLVDEAALVEALDAGRIGGAGLDVFEDEPFRPANPLARFRNVVLTPHISAGTRDAFETKMRALFDNLGRFYDGLAVENEIDFRSERAA